MKWRVELAKQALTFIDRNDISKEQIFYIIAEAIRNFQGETVSIDIKKMKGQWQGFYRIRKGKWRLVAEFNFDTRFVFIENIDWRGSIY